MEFLLLSNLPHPAAAGGPLTLGTNADGFKLVAGGATDTYEIEIDSANQPFAVGLSTGYVCFSVAIPTDPNINAVTVDMYDQALAGIAKQPGTYQIQIKATGGCPGAAYGIRGVIPTILQATSSEPLSENIGSPYEFDFYTVTGLSNTVGGYEIGFRGQNNYRRVYMGVYSYTSSGGLVMNGTNIGSAQETLFPYKVAYNNSNIPIPIITIYEEDEAATGSYKISTLNQSVNTASNYSCSFSFHSSFYNKDYSYCFDFDSQWNVTTATAYCNNSGFASSPGSFSSSQSCAQVHSSSTINLNCSILPYGVGEAAGAVTLRSYNTSISNGDCTSDTFFKGLVTQ